MRIATTRVRSDEGNDTEAKSEDSAEALLPRKLCTVERELAASGEVDRIGQVFKKSDEARLALERMKRDLAERRLDREGRAKNFKGDREARAQEF